MADTTTLGTGVYDLAEASYLLSVSERQLASWSRKTDKGERALVPPTHGWAYSFHDLLSLAVVAVFYQRQVDRAGVLRTIEFLQQQYGLDRPLASKRVIDALLTTQGHVLWRDTDLTRGGQQVLTTTIRDYLRPIEYGPDAMARLWKPWRSVVLDPEVQAGRPCIANTRVTTDVVAGRSEAGETARLIATDLGITARQVSDAVQFEKRLREGEGLALVA